MNVRDYLDNLNADAKIMRKRVLKWGETIFESYFN